jgi:hypothetical protein
MAKKKSNTSGRNRNADKGGTLAAAPVWEDESPCRWPESLAPWRTALFMAIASGALAALAYGAAALGGFTALKITLAALLGSGTPENVYTSNYDIATVIWGLGSIALAGYVHPALGISLLVLGRSWLDGYTFPLDNIYFTWSIYLLCMLWAIRLLRSKRPLHFPPPVLIFAAVIVWIFATAPFSIQYYNTSQMLWLWLGYGLLFLLCLNTSREPGVSNILLTVFLVALGMQAVFSILHFEFLLPYLRKIVQNPAVLRRYFNTDAISPEMARRFMVNRAFGTMLFPNALAAYLLLGIPFVLFMSVPYGRAFRGMLRQLPAAKTEPESRVERAVILGIAIAFGFGVFVFIQFVAYFPIEYRANATALPLYLRTVPLFTLSLAAGCVSGLATLFLLMRLGLKRWWVGLRSVATVMLAIILLYTLWITYSRGAYLALFASVTWAGIVYYTPPARLHRLSARFRRRETAALLILLPTLACLSVILVHAVTSGNSWAQDPSAAAAQAPGPSPGAMPVSRGVKVNEEGISLSMSDLADPASFRLRLGYWRVALRIALHHWLTGTGIGNFSIAYPRYQHVGAGDVREAHNGFLQFFADTGVVGGALLLAFWAWFALWGARRIILEEYPHKKLFLLGIYAGLIAFCMHAFVDINFSHPSLMMLAMTWAGLFYGHAAAAPNTDPNPEEPVPTGRRRLAARATACLLPVIILAAMAGSARVYFQQLSLNRMRFINLSCESELNRRMEAGLFFFKDLAQFAFRRDAGEKNLTLPRLPLSKALLIVDDLDELKKGCTFYKPIPDQVGRFARMEKDEPVPMNALVAVTRPWMVREMAIRSCLKWIEELERQDRRFPHSPILALHLVRWYELYANFNMPEFSAQEPEWIAKYLKWSEIMVQRNPCHADMRMFYTNSLIWKLLEAYGTEKDALPAKIEEEYETILRLSPITPQHRHMYAGALDQLADNATKQGLETDAAAYREKAQKMRDAVKILEEQRREAHLYQ